MADKGPFLTACIIFYLSIGAAIFQILEEPNWVSARDNYSLEKENILRKYDCLTKEDLDDILEIVAGAAGQGVPITGDKHQSTWDWGNSVIFAATIVTTIGYGNVAPKTEGGRVFCILYGLCGIPLCLVWISQLGSFFGDRARRLSQIMIRKGVSVKKVQLTCTACFLLWGLIVHLLIPPFVFMSVEEWSYLEGLYFSFITLTTVGFGDYVAGVNPNIQYPRLYRVLAELWIYMGLAWLSLFFSWNVHMVVTAHKVLRKRRNRHRQYYEEENLLEEDNQTPEAKPTVIDIFNFMNETNEDDYNTVIGQIAVDAEKATPPENINRSKSCSDIFHIQSLEQSPRQKRRKSISEMFLKVLPSKVNTTEEHKDLQEKDENKDSATKNDGESDVENEGIIFTVPANTEPAKTQNVKSPTNGESRFRITKVPETDLLPVKEEEG